MVQICNKERVREREKERERERGREGEREEETKSTGGTSPAMLGCMDSSASSDSTKGFSKASCDSKSGRATRLGYSLFWYLSMESA